MTQRLLASSLLLLLLAVPGLAQPYDAPKKEGDPLSAAEAAWVDSIHTKKRIKVVRHERLDWKELYGGVIMGYFGDGVTNSPRPIPVRMITLELEADEIRRLWFESEDAALVFGAYVDWYEEDSLKTHMVEVRGKQAVLLRGDSLDAAAPATFVLRDHAWSSLPAPTKPDLISISRGWESSAVTSVKKGPLHVAWKDSLAKLERIIAAGNPDSELIHGKKAGARDFAFWGDNFAGRLVETDSTVSSSSSNASSRQESERLSTVVETLLREAQEPPVDEKAKVQQETPGPQYRSKGGLLGGLGR